jgi:carbonic anhydrase/acetyltransferase-like protein (isoleucine patch superfamily)
MKYLSPLFLYICDLAARLRAKSFSMLASGAFAHFGKETMLMCPVRLSGERRISIGARVFIGADSWLQTLPDGESQSVAITIGDGVSFSGSCVISAVRMVRLEDEVLLARNVYISDHIHKYTQVGTPILAQGLDKISPVLIRRGAWLGQNVVVCPGVTIGQGSVIGANSVVTQSIPDFCVAVGSPARVVRSIKASDSSTSTEHQLSNFAKA